MTRYSCNTCDGVYLDPQPNGQRYFHRCPPLDRVRVRRPDGTDAIVDRVRVGAGDRFLEDAPEDRPDVRDENLVRAADDTPQIRAEGKGRTELRA